MMTSNENSGRFAKFALLIILGMLNFQIAEAQSSLMGSSGILGKLLNVVDQAEKRNLEIVRIEADVIQTTRETIRTLDPSFTHTIVAMGSDRIKEIGIEVYKEVNKKWVLVEKEDDMTAAAVAIKPNEMAEYKIVVKVNLFNPGFKAGHFGLIFMIE
jgi:hypothetical protein